MFHSMNKIFNRFRHVFDKYVIKYVIKTNIVWLLLVSFSRC